MSSNEAFAERVPSSRAFHTTSAAIECRVVQSASTAVECRCTGSGLIKLVKFGTAHDALQTRRIVRMGTQTAFNRTQRIVFFVYPLRYYQWTLHCKLYNTQRTWLSTW